MPGPAPAMPPMPGMPPPPLAGMPPPVVEHQYYLGVAGQQYGPFSASQVVQMVQSSQIVVAGTKVWRAGLAVWGELGHLPELAMLLQAPAAPMMPPPLV